MVEYRKGKVTSDAPSLDMIVNPVDCLDKLNNPLAIRLKYRYKQIAKEYHDLCNAKHYSRELLGQVQLISPREKKVFLSRAPKTTALIANVFSQFFPSKKGEDVVDYMSFKNALLLLRLYCEVLTPEIDTQWLIGFERFTSEVQSENDWNEMEKIIHEVFDKSECVFAYIYDGITEQEGQD